MSNFKSLGFRMPAAGENSGVVQLRLLLESLFQTELSESELSERISESTRQGIALLRSAEYTSGGIVLEFIVYILNYIF